MKKNLCDLFFWCWRKLDFLIPSNLLINKFVRISFCLLSPYYDAMIEIFGFLTRLFTPQFLILFSNCLRHLPFFALIYNSISQSITRFQYLNNIYSIDSTETSLSSILLFLFHFFVELNVDAIWFLFALSSTEWKRVKQSILMSYLALCLVFLSLYAVHIESLASHCLSHNIVSFIFVEQN